MNGVDLIDATVTRVEINSGGNGGGLHTVSVQDPAGGKQTLTARWLVDATGRNRVLQKHLQLQEKVVEQKNVFWFRLANFNPEILSHLNAIKTPQSLLRSLLRDASFLRQGQLDLVHPHALAG